jgi:5-oxoprolinase (ATP-hydrolysing)
MNSRERRIHHMAAAASLRVGFDIGGTFTDFILLDGAGAALHIHKRLTTPADPAAGAIQGLDELLARAAVAWPDVELVVHGTTIITNAIIQRSGGRICLITTRGFRDTVEMGTEQRYDIHDLFLKFPAPLVPRALRLEVTERISRDGEVLTSIDAEEVRACLRRAVSAGLEAVAVSFLHAYKNSAHEQLVASLAAAEFPQLRISLSSEVCGEIREYERTTTTTANAYVQPLIGPYVARIEQALAQRGFAGRFFLMQSSGGLASPEMARRFPIRLLESGPAGGGIAAGHFGRLAGHRDVVSFDMGGTTAKICLIQDGQADIAPAMEAAREHRFKRGSGLPIRAPTIDMIEIGAGGGSIASFDELKLLKVGPESAGATPGPASYGLGGTAPTVTDANLLLGYLGADSFLGGRLRLDTAAAATALAGLGAQLGCPAVEAAWGVFAVVCENMAGAARVHIVEKGRDPRGYSMIAFGGAGPAHAVRVAKSLGIGSVIVPPASGGASALGFLAGRVEHEAVRSNPGLLARSDWSVVNDILGDLEADGRAYLEAAGVAAAEIEVVRAAEMKMPGQVHTLRVAVPPGALGAPAIAALGERFAADFETCYGRAPFGSDLEVISWRVTCRSPAGDLGRPRIHRKATAKARETRREVWFPETAGFVDSLVLDRYALRPGEVFSGPLIVEEDEATTVIPPGDTLTVDANANLVITVQRSAPRVRASALATPFERQVAELERDPIGLEIMWSRLVTISEEMWLTVIRTAFSLIIGEMQDFACEILDARGKSLAHSPRAMPVFNLTLMAAINSMLEEYPPETLLPGDVLITNDPWLCAGHLFDIAVVTPVFRGGRLVALAGSVGHVSDIGGTKDRMRAREIFDEGLQIPPMKLFNAGAANRDLFRMIGLNVRNGAQVIGDVEALVSANAVGAQRLQSFMTDYGLNDLEAIAHVVQGRAEQAMRAAVRAVPDGVYHSEVCNRMFGKHQRFPVRIIVDGDAIEIDYAGTPAQLPMGGLNCTFRFTEAESVFPLKCLLTPGIRASAGCYRPFTVKAPAGSMLNCTRPASTGLRHLTGWYLVGNLFQAMSTAMPTQVRAFTGLPTILGVYGQDRTGRLYNDHIFMGGGQGGGHGADGKSAMLWPTSAASGSIEMFETRAPMLVLEKCYVTDSGGAGTFRGGLGQRVRVRRLRDDAEITNINVNPDSEELTTDGMFGGMPGGIVKAQLFEDGKLAKEYHAGALEEMTRQSMVMDVAVGGGAGYGDPLRRDLAAVQADLDGGYISAAAAERFYGCVLDAQGRIDMAATTRRRAVAYLPTAD